MQREFHFSIFENIEVLLHVKILLNKYYKYNKTEILENSEF